MFDKLFNFIDIIVVKDIGSMISTFIAIISPLIGACVGIYVVFVVMRSLFNPENLIVRDVIFMFISLAFVTTVAFSTTWYMAHLVPFVTSAGDEITTGLLGGTSIASSLQAMFDQFVVNLSDIWKEFKFDVFESSAWIDAVLRSLMSAVLIIGVIPFIAISTGYILIAKLMLGLLLILGPLFIMMAFFPTSRSYFQSWSGLVFNNILLTIIYPIAFTYFSATLAHVIGTNDFTFWTLLLTFILYASLFVLAMQIPTLCSTLSGGFGINGVGGQFMALGRAGGNTLKFAGKGISNAKDRVDGSGKPSVSAG